MIKRYRPELFAGLIHIAVLMVFDHACTGIWEGDYSFSVFFGYADQMADGRIPYRDFDTEYPPIALLMLLLPRLLTASEVHYQILFGVQILIFDLIGLLLVMDLARRLDRSPLLAGGVYTVALLAVGPIITERFDFIPAIMTLLSLYAFLRGRLCIAWGVLGIAFLTKLYPIVIAPLFIIYLFGRKEYRHILKGILVLLVTVMVIAIPFLLLDAASFLDSYTYHTERGLQIESSYASALMLGDELGLTTVEQQFNHAAWHLAGPLADTLADYALLIGVAVLAGVYFLYLRGNRHIDTPDRITVDARLLNHALMAVAAFLLTSKVFSPQFIIWLCPLIPLISGRYRIAAWAFFLVTGVLTYYIYPGHYGELLMRQPKLVYILVARNSLILLLGLSLIQWRWNRPVPEETAR